MKVLQKGEVRLEPKWFPTMVLGSVLEPRFLVPIEFGKYVRRLLLRLIFLYMPEGSENQHNLSNSKVNAVRDFPVSRLVL